MDRRGWLGWLLVPTLMVLIYWVVMNAEPSQRLLLTYVWVWFLLITPVEMMFFFMRNRIYAHPQSDSAHLREMTPVPSVVWGVLFLAGTIAALVYGGAILLRIES